MATSNDCVNQVSDNNGAMEFPVNENAGTENIGFSGMTMMQPVLRVGQRGQCVCGGEDEKLQAAIRIVACNQHCVAYPFFSFFGFLICSMLAAAAFLAGSSLSFAIGSSTGMTDSSPIAPSTLTAKFLA